MVGWRPPKSTPGINDTLFSGPFYPSWGAGAGYRSGPITVIASIDSQPLSPPCTWNPTAPGKQWRTCPYLFAAAAAVTSLTIVATEGQNFIGLDNVSVQCLSSLGAKGLCI